MFETIKVLLSPRKAVRTIQSAENQHDRLTMKFERALASRLAGTYGKAYDAGFEQGRQLGAEQGRSKERAYLLSHGVKLPPDIMGSG